MRSGKAVMRLVLLLGVLLSLSLFGDASAEGQSSAPEQETGEEAALGSATAPVIVDGVTLFRVTGISAFPPEKRAAAIADRIRTAAANRANGTSSLTLQEVPLGTQIVAGDQPIMIVIDEDARLEHVGRPVLAQAFIVRIGEAMLEFRRDRDPTLLLRRGIYALLALLALLIGLWIGHRMVRRIRTGLEQRYKEKIHGVQIQSLHLIHAEHVWRGLRTVLNVVWAVVALIAAYIATHYILSLFPWTRGLGNSMSALVLNPLVTIGTAFLNSVPNLIFLGVLAVVTWYVLKLIRLFFAGVESGAIELSGFEAGWAKPTYRLVRVAVIAFALVAAYPYIPGSDSQAFKGVSLLIGVIFSLGSTSLIGNMISGYSMAYRRTFQLGDRVKIGDHVGDVEETKLMVTYLRTPKNEIVAVPNSLIVGAEVVNYSALAKKDGLVLHTTVGIGYETSWRQVEAMLLKAADLTPGLLREPKPFVLQKELGDFAVTYEINAYCNEPRAMARLYTALHANILDVFNEYGVQIMTPAYEGDPEQAKIVPKDQWYTAPARSQHDGNGASTATAHERNMASEGPSKTVG